MQRFSRFRLVILMSAGLVAPAIGALAALGFADTALASGSSTPSCGKAPLLPCNSLAVTGPIAAAAGVSFPLKARGYANPAVGAPNPANEVVGWNTALPCKSTYTQEVTAEGSTAANLDGLVNGKFFKTFTVPASSVTVPVGSNQATYYWCVYLTNSTKKRTFKAAFWTYSVLGHGPGPGGPIGAP